MFVTIINMPLCSIANWFLYQGKLNYNRDVCKSTVSQGRPITVWIQAEEAYDFSREFLKLIEIQGHVHICHVLFPYGVYVDCKEVGYFWQR